MDSTEELYRATMEDQRLFDDIRRHIDKQRDDFAETGQWCETEHAIEQVDRRDREGPSGDPATRQQARKADQARDKQFLKAGWTKPPRTPKSTQLKRLSSCAEDLLNDNPDVTNYERSERLTIARRIIFVTWLMTDPDAAELKLGLTSLETIPWDGDWGEGVGRSVVRDDIIPRGWMKLARHAWQALCEATAEKQPLGDEASGQKLLSLQETAERLNIDRTTLRRHRDAKPPKIPPSIFVTSGGKEKVLESALDAWILEMSKESQKNLSDA